VRDHGIRQIRLGAEFESLPSAANRVLPSSYLDPLGIPRPEIHYDLSPYVAGSGLFPSSGTANPSLTIAALALRAAKAILEQLGAAGATTA